MRLSRFATALAFGTLVGACTVGPDYRRPEITIPAAWRGSAEGGEITVAAWWERFQDPVLTGLVAQALEGNKDLAIAAANVDEAFARYGVARAGLFPQIDANVSAARGNGAATARSASNDYVGGLSAAFEIDVWGRLRRANESARAALVANEEGRQTVLLTLIAAVANGYIELRALDRQLEIATATSRSLGEAARLQRVRFEHGAVPESDFRQAESQYRNATSQVPELERRIARQENFLSVLVGRSPGPIERGRVLDALEFPPPPCGLPAEILERRPDIRRAEQQLIAANADIGVARAAYFPRISLTGLLGVESAQLSGLFKGPSKAWSYGTGITAPLFSAGRIRGQVDQAKALEREALARYQKAVISGFQDVEDALADRTRLAEALEARAQNLAALQRFRQLAILRYRQGATIYLEVAQAEESLFNAQLAYVNTQSQLFQSYANLYKAMGGGWPAQLESSGRDDG